MEVNNEWRRLLSGLKEKARLTSPLTVYVMGVSDSGKSTLCRYLAGNLTVAGQVAYIDCDPGQSTVGPPATIGMHIYAVSGVETGHDDVKQPIEILSPPLLRFIGSKTPMDHILPILTGIKRLNERAAESGSKVIIMDSCGFASGNAGREFQFHVIDLLQPGYIIALQREKELEGLLVNFVKRPGLVIERLAISPAIEPRSMEKRQEYRRQKFMDYFKDAGMHEIPLAGLGFHGRVQDDTLIEALDQLLVALCDSENDVVTIGILRGIDQEKKVLRLCAPSFDLSRVVSLHLGSLYLDPVTFQDQQ